MKQRQGSVFSIVVAGTIAVVILLVVGSLITSGFSRGNRDTSSLIKKYLKLDDAVIVTDSQRLKEPVPQSLELYAEELLQKLLAAPFNQNTPTTNGEGILYFIPPYTVGFDDLPIKQVEKFTIRLFTSSKDNVLKVGIYNDDTKELLELENSLNNDKLDGKKFCMIDADSISDIRDVLSYSQHVAFFTEKKDSKAEFDSRRYKVSMADFEPYVPKTNLAEIISKNLREDFILFFEKIDGEIGLYTIVDGKQRLLDLPQVWGSRMPVYVYKNTLCFLETKDTTDDYDSRYDHRRDLGALFYLKDDNFLMMSGHGPLASNSHKQLYERYKNLQSTT